jgi:hypothetical protein
LTFCLDNLTIWRAFFPTHRYPNAVGIQLAHDKSRNSRQGIFLAEAFAFLQVQPGICNIGKQIIATVYGKNLWRRVAAKGF